MLYDTGALLCNVIDDTEQNSRNCNVRKLLIRIIYNVIKRFCDFDCLVSSFKLYSHTRQNSHFDTRIDL